MSISTAVTLALAVVIPFPGIQSGAAADRAAVQQAALDYVEGLYEADVTRIERTISIGETGK